MTTPPATDAALVAWPASRLGPLLHLNAHRPDPARFRPPSMAGEAIPRDRLVAERHAKRHGRRPRFLHEPRGGFWTFSTWATPAEFAGALCNASPSLCRGRSWWMLTPLSEARLLVLVNEDAWRSACARFPHADGDELDFAAVAAAGYAAVHSPITPPGGPRPASRWGPGVTCWLTWAFVGEAEPLT